MARVGLAFHYFLLFSFFLCISYFVLEHLIPFTLATFICNVIIVVSGTGITAATAVATRYGLLLLAHTFAISFWGWCICVCVCVCVYLRYRYNCICGGICKRKIQPFFLLTFSSYIRHTFMHVRYVPAQ